MKSKVLFQLILGVMCFFGCNNRDYDIIILNGEVYDGSGNAPFNADIAIKDSTIVKIGDLSEGKATRIIDAKGMAVAPGFIDMHAHLDPILTLSDCESHVRQGVTTALGGPDGGSPWPIKAHLDTLKQIGVGMNIAYLVGHNQIRKNIMALENRAPTQEELEKMKAQVKLAMEEGAFGISTGLKYLPGAFSEVDEVIELSKVASSMGGIYTSHLREEGLGLFGAVAEAISISEKADIPVILTHHKAIGKPMWGKSNVTLAMVDSARTAGLNIKIDQYPYSASHTGISVLIPSWARAGGTEAFKERVQNAQLRDSIKAGIIFNILNDRGGNDLTRIQFAKVKWMKELEGKTLQYWCELRGLEPTLANGADLVIEAQVNGGASCIYHAMHEEDVERIMKHPQTMIASDGRLVRPGQGHPHPRWYGTFPRVLGHYVRERAVITLPEAIYKMTKLPAISLGLTNRGTIAENMMADIVVFDPNTIIDKATFEEPHQYPEGIHFVLVNGQISIDESKFEDIKAGKILRKNE
ncbi:D-aminoacylase [Flagellimonas hymeniacidonis]|uniref:D-aminoacylase n=1 Tax=Flagellimonas hymeniacidonis TaxID=2603628 RepID=A0A5C8V2W5_9FLAO|nr:D-aminoacylase [Flagellimonas hymeniacidonis]TXN36103.1 D-aminoacylase [Flagellimonas hymeniacidonis]